MSIELDDDIDILPAPRIVGANRPVMTDDVSDRVKDFLARWRERDKWEAWGLDNLRKQGSALLLTGPPGTGKTTIAKYISDQIKKGYKLLDISAITGGGGEPGSVEKKAKEFFADCRKRKNATVILDECDHILLDRDKITGDALTWMLGLIEVIMMEMNNYPGCVIAMTNHPGMMDPALSDRFMDIIHIEKPDFTGRKQLWIVKMPRKLPLRLTEGELRMLAKVPLTGRQIETAIIKGASHAIRKKLKPTAKMMLEAAHQIVKQKLA